MKPKFKVTQSPDGTVSIHSPENVDPKTLYRLGMTEMAKRQFGEVAPKVFGFIPNIENKDDLVHLGEVLWQKTYRSTQVDNEAGNNLVEWAEAQDPAFMDFFKVEQNQIVYFALSRWADQAFPTVTMGEKFCAALMATGIPEEMLDEVQAPWRSFVIEVPGKMLSVFDADAMRRTRIVRVLVHKTDHPKEPWRWVAFGEKGQHVWRIGPTDYMLQPVSFGKQIEAHYRETSDAFDNDLHRDERLYVLIGRLILNTCLAIADPDQVRQLGSSHKRFKEREGRHGPPEQRVFQLGRTIQLDCRDKVREYIEGERTERTLKVQTLVRGYYRQQPYGPRNSLRRKQWVLPYYKGPEDAPILRKTHSFRDE